jgi:hypothetical protein
MLTLLYFLLLLIAILAVMRILPLAILATGYFWLWHSHRWILITALLIGAVIGLWKALHNGDQPTIHSPSSTVLPTRHRLRQRLRRGLFR